MSNGWEERLREAIDTSSIAKLASEQGPPTPANSTVPNEKKKAHVVAVELSDEFRSRINTFVGIMLEHHVWPPTELGYKVYEPKTNQKSGLLGLFGYGGRDIQKFEYKNISAWLLTRKTEYGGFDSFNGAPFSEGQISHRYVHWGLAFDARGMLHRYMSGYAPRFDSYIRTKHTIVGNKLWMPSPSINSEGGERWMGEVRGDTDEAPGYFGGQVVGDFVQNQRGKTKLVQLEDYLQKLALESLGLDSRPNT